MSFVAMIQRKRTRNYASGQVEVMLQSRSWPATHWQRSAQGADRVDPSAARAYDGARGGGGRPPTNRRPVAVDSTGREVACSADREDTGSMDFPDTSGSVPWRSIRTGCSKAWPTWSGRASTPGTRRATAIRSPRLIAGRRRGGRRGRDRRQAALLGIRAGRDAGALARPVLPVRWQEYRRQPDRGADRRRVDQAADRRHQSAGDLFAVPLAVGIAVGRVGCYLTGLDDHTYGLDDTPLGRRLRRRRGATRPAHTRSASARC